MTEVEATPAVEEVPVEKTGKDDTRSRKDRVTGTVHFGDTDFTTEEVGSASWGEVCKACCTHSPMEWLQILGAVAVILFFLYFFLFALGLMGTSFKVLTGCATGGVLGEETNPVGAMMLGILATVLLQSSSTTTSITVALVGAGLNARTGIYMIMGANIGTTVTNTIVAMGQIGDADQLERAFAGATVHDMFNYLTVAILLPVEVITGYLYYVAKALTNEDSVTKGDKWEGPVKKLVDPLVNEIIIANKKVSQKIAESYIKNGEDPEAYPEVMSCKNDFYPISCTAGEPVNYNNCKNVGLISCDKKTNRCPAFFQPDATQRDDETSGGVCLFVSLIILVICLVGMVSLLQKMLLGVSTRIIYKATDFHPFVAITVGALVTMLVQSSSITTSVLTPFVGLGVIRLEAMFPLSLGANIGTTVTALLAAQVSDKVQSLQVAIAHLLFNITGILIWYPIPFMREVPLNMARALGKATRLYRFFPIVYIFILFFVIPGVLIGVSMLFEEGSAGFEGLGIICAVLIIVGFLYGLFVWKKRDGRARFINYLTKRQERSDTFASLPDDMSFLKAEVARLKEHTGLADDDVEKDNSDTSPGDDA